MKIEPMSDEQLKEINDAMPSDAKYGDIFKAVELHSRINALRQAEKLIHSALYDHPGYTIAYVEQFHLDIKSLLSEIEKERGNL